MLTIENAIRVGLVLVVLSAVLDVIVTVAGGGHAGRHGLLPEHTAHLIGLVGMVLVLAGVVGFGVRRHLDRRQRAAARSGGPSHAPR